MLLDIAIVALLLTVGNVIFRRFEPRVSFRRRALKTLAALCITAVISYYFGRTGVIIGFGIALLPVIYVHGIWLPRHGVNGLTGEPREKYYALRGWPPEGSES